LLLGSGPYRTAVVEAEHEGPLDYLARVVKARPELEGPASDITQRYVAARYGLDATRDDLRELGRRVRAFRVA
jgi:hypothetical protein